MNGQTGKKYHVTTQEYYRQIRAVSDRLCREHGLSVIMEGQSSKAVSYIEWLRQSKGQPTFRSMLEADLRTAIEDANDLGHFLLLMEHMGWEISHGNRLGFRLRGQEHFMVPGRKNPLFTEDGIRAAILGNLSAIEAGRQLPSTYRVPYQPYKKHPKYTGFLALYIHYLYVLGKIEKRQYPPRMTPQLRKEVVRFERCREQFAFLRENDITTQEDMTALADAVGIGHQTMSRVMQIDEHAPAAVKEALDSGELSVNQGYNITKQVQALPEEQREEAAAQAVELLKAKKDIQAIDAEADRRGKIAALFCKAFERAVLLTPTEVNVRIWVENTRMRPNEIEDSVKEARELAEVFSTIAGILETMLPGGPKDG